MATELSAEDERLAAAMQQFASIALTAKREKVRQCPINAINHEPHCVANTEFRI